MKAHPDVVAGIDLGGTATRIAIVEKLSGELASSRTVLTESLAGTSKAETMDRLVAAICDVVGSTGPLGALGIGASGPIDTANGVIRNPDTLAGFSGFSIVEELISRLELPVLLANDTVCAALGEYATGSSSGSRRPLMVTLGTGVGVALLDGGVPFKGTSEEHPEAGHIGVGLSLERCYCGAQGCWEQMASRTALERLASSLLPEDIEPVRRLAWLVENSKTDRDVQRVLEVYGVDVGRGLSVLSNVYSPDKIVLGGSVARLLPVFRNSMVASMGKNGAFNREVSIVESALGSLAGALGAASTVRDHTGPLDQ